MPGEPFKGSDENSLLIKGPFFFSQPEQDLEQPVLLDIIVPREEADDGRSSFFVLE